MASLNEVEYRLRSIETNYPTRFNKIESDLSQLRNDFEAYKSHTHAASAISGLAAFVEGRAALTNREFFNFPGRGSGEPDPNLVNNTGKPLLVFVSVSEVRGDSETKFYVNNQLVAALSSSGSSSYGGGGDHGVTTYYSRGATAAFLVPPGATYTADRGFANSDTRVCYRCW